MTSEYFLGIYTSKRDGPNTNHGNRSISFTYDTYLPYLLSRYLGSDNLIRSKLLFFSFNLNEYLSTLIGLCLMSFQGHFSETLRAQTVDAGKDQAGWYCEM